MKKTLAVLLALVMLSATAFAAADFHIGIVTGTVSQSEDDLRGAEALIEKYGAVADGGIIQHMTYPDNFMEEQETTISVISGLADDPLMKAVIVNQAVPGTAEAFMRIKEARPDILCFAGESHEEPYIISDRADLATSNDFIARGVLMIKTAHDLGCETFVHISFPRHLSMEKMSRRMAIMKMTCEYYGMDFESVSAPDPTSDVGIAGAQQYILEKTPEWIAQFGENTAFFCTNDAHTEPLLKQLLTYGGYFVEADLPSPLMGYPGALGIDLSAEAGDFPAILAKVEQAVCEQGGAGRFGTWAYSYGYTTTAALGELAIQAVQAEMAGEEFDVTDIDNISAAFDAYTPGASWNGSYLVDATSGVEYPNFVLVYQDTYIMGDPGYYMGNTNVYIPDEAFYLTGQESDADLAQIAAGIVIE